MNIIKKVMIFASLGLSLLATTSFAQTLFCIQVITYATDPITGSCRAFPTPCDVPDGWQISSSGCPIATTTVTPTTTTTVTPTSTTTTTLKKRQKIQLDR